MKLKGLAPRAYNIFFHTHTVSGIVISVALYVIFFAGAFTLFIGEFKQWEDPAARTALIKEVPYEQLIRRIDSVYPGFSQGEEVGLRLGTHENPLYNIYGHVHEQDGKEKYFSFLYNPVTGALTESGTGAGATTGSTLYRLHFLDQIPVAGRWLSGFVALFFLFASMTGVLVHWRNIVSKFYAFSFKGLRKQLWTNAHTVFGLIGLPYQLMYAVTGAFYVLSLLILAPTVLLLFKGNQDKLIGLIYPSEALHELPAGKASNQLMTVSEGFAQLESSYPAYSITFAELLHPGHENAMLAVQLNKDGQFNGSGLAVINLADGSTRMERLPESRPYIEKVLPAIANLHFATFGGLLLKAIYFAMALFTCFVIISGVLIWKEARKKKNYTDRQKRFHHRVTMLYLAVCLGLFPAVAVLFMAELWVPFTANHASIVNSIFFLSWLLLAIVGCFLKTESRIVRFNVLLAGLLSLGVPLTNGWVTGDWIWVAYAKNNPFVWGTDLFWLVTGLLSIAVGIYMRPGKKYLPARPALQEG